MSDDFGKIKSVQPLGNVHHLTSADKDRRGGAKNSYRKRQDDQQQQRDQSSEPEEKKNGLSDGHTIDIRA